MSGASAVTIRPASPKMHRVVKFSSPAYMWSFLTQEFIWCSSLLQGERRAMCYAPPYASGSTSPCDFLSGAGANESGLDRCSSIPPGARTRDRDGVRGITLHTQRGTGYPEHPAKC